MSRLIFTAIGKFVDPEQPEGVGHKSIEDPDFLFKCAIDPDEIIIYEEWFENPAYKVYNHKGPFVCVKMSTCNERMLICSFEEFDKKYMTAMQDLVNFKHN